MRFRIIIGVILVVISWMAVLGETSMLPHNSFMVTGSSSSSCRTVGECVGEEKEMAMDSEVNRRLVEENKRYISYDALKKDVVPCNRKGQSYYNCTKMKKANPYQRGCSTITHCKRYTG